MLETTDWIILITLITVLSGIFGGIWASLGRYLADRRLTNIEADIESLVMTINSRKGEQARSDKAARMEAAMLEAGQIMQDPKIEDKKTAILQLAGKYPDIAMSLAKKYIGL